MAKPVFKQTNLEEAWAAYVGESGHRFMVYSQALIILLIYELLFAASRNAHVLPYNGSEFWFKLFNSLFQYGTATFSVLIGGYLAYWLYMDWFGRKTWKQMREERRAMKAFGGKMPKDFGAMPRRYYRPNWYYFGFQFVEGFAYGTLIYLCLQVILYVLLILPENGFLEPRALDAAPSLLRYHTSPWQDLALAFGAGFYEELLFRYLLFWALLEMAGRYKYFGRFKADATASPSLPGKIMAYNPRNSAFLTAVIWGSVFYSLSHYVYYFGDTFSVYSFLYRLVFGYLMYYIFAKRHIGIVMWAHVVHDAWYFLLR